MMTAEGARPSYEEVTAELVQAHALLARAGIDPNSRPKDIGPELAVPIELSPKVMIAAESEALSPKLRNREALDRAILASSTDYAIISLDVGGLVTSWNEGAVRTMGWTEKEMMGEPAHVFFTDDEVAQGIPTQEMRQARETGRGEDERFHQRKDGSRFWANGLMMPLEADGAHVGYVKILRDRTEQHEAQQELTRLADELAFDRATMKAVFENAPVGLSLATAGGESALLNEEMRRILGRDISQGGIERYLGAGAIREDGAPYELADYPQVAALRDGVETHRAPFLVERLDGGRVRTEISSVPLRDEDGTVTGAVSVVIDVEERERAAEHHTMLTGELAHRMKNTMAMVQAIVHQSLRSAKTLEEARESVVSRFEALVRAQDLLTSADWKPTDLGEVVRTAVEAADHGGQLSMAGCQVEVGARAALSFTLVLHELATNAVKYGALSNPEGRVDIHWRIEPRLEGKFLWFEWREHGGPLVAPPTRKGFGTRLIDSMGRTFAGRTELRYDPTGVCWIVEADTRRLAIG